ncbi:MAG: Cell division protein FtsI [Peptidoglycan synthetase], partial [uncultured Quadrisphaera sp.]
ASADRRGAVLTAVVLALLVVFSGRLLQLQAVDSRELAAVALAGRTTTVPLPASRGDITAADGSVLAASVERRDVVVDQTLVEDPAATAAAIVPLVEGADPAAVQEALTGDRRWAVVVKGVTPAEWRAVDALDLTGVYAEQASLRTYPSGNVAGNLIGWVGRDGEARAGLEITQDEVLTGTPGSETFEQGAKGQRIPMGEASRVAPVPGHDVHLTIDRDLQWYAQRAIAAQVEVMRAEWGAVTVTDPRTGELLALAESGTVDPNDPGASAVEERGNRSLQQVIEPGSTAKVVTAAAALEEGLVTPTTAFRIPDRYTAPNGQTFRDSSPHPEQKLTFAGVLASSSNTGTVMVGERLSRQQRYDYLRAFGLGEESALGFPGESAGILQGPDDWDGRKQYTVLFGQGFAATMLQSAQVFATIANGGVRMPTHAIAGTTAPDGTFTPADPGEGVRVVSETTADQVLSMLEGAVGEGGTGGNAAVPGFRVAGKTGTAQAAGENGYADRQYTSSFIGMAPAEDPELVVSVVVQRPQEAYYGGTVAAPVFSDVMSYALAQRGVAPTGTEPDLVPLTWE